MSFSNAGPMASCARSISLTLFRVAAAAAPARSGVLPFLPLNASIARRTSPHRPACGPFHTSERRGGVERRQLELKGVEGGD